MIAGLIQLLTGAQARWIGSQPEPKRRVYFANHASNLDGPTIWASLPPALRSRTRPVAAQDYWDAGPIRRYLSGRVFRALLISRDKITRENNPLTRMSEALEAGDSLIIFPEGTRTLDDEGAMGAFKPGLHHLARKHPDVEFVPVHLENLNRILPKGQYLLVPLIAVVRFGSPVALGEGETKEAFLQRAHAAVAGLAEDQGGQG